MTSRSHRTIAILGALALAVVGCQKTSVGPKAADYQKQRAAIIAKEKQKAMGDVPAALEPETRKKVQKLEPALAGGGRADYVYDPLGKRDPFRSFVLDRLRELDLSTKGPLEQFELSQLDVLGVVWETKRPRALVSDPSGQGYIVRVGDPIGKNDGRVVSIADNLVRVKETYVDYVGEKTTKEIEMRVRQSEGG